MKPKKQFRPSDLRTLLVVMLVIITLAGGALFYWGLTLVRDYAVSVNERSIDASASAQQIEELQLLKSQLSQSNSLVDKANQLFSTPESYQAQILGDVQKYAAAAGISIDSTSNNDPSTGVAYGITVRFEEPVAYSQLIGFLNNIEGNVPKLQVSEISLGHADIGGQDSVRVGDIKIEIAVR